MTARSTLVLLAVAMVVTSVLPGGVTNWVERR